jgi:hypothetical protein
VDRIKEMLDRIAELSEAELSELEGQVLSEFEAVEKAEINAQTVETMTQLADALDTVRNEQNTRSEQAAELSRRAEEAKGRIKGATAPAEEGEPDAEVAEVAEEQPVAVAAAAESEGSSQQAEGEKAVENATAEGNVTGQTPDSDLKAGEEQGGHVQPATQDVLGATAETVEPVADPAAQASVQPAEVATSEENKPASETSEATEPGEDKSEGTVTASATPEASELQVVAPADRQPIVRQQATVAITAGADIPGVSAGSPLDNMNAVAKAMADRMHQMRRTSGGDGEQHTVATLVASFPEDRTLRTNDPDGNAAKIEGVISPQAITAAGGLCAPVNVRYDLFGLGDLGRPVKDALAPFNADRGGIRFITPPVLTDLTGAVSLWTVQDDIDAAAPGSTHPAKPCLRVGCGAEITVYTEAIPLCLTFGNMGARAYPELVARNNALGMIQHARFAETRLLTRIGTLSTAVSAARRIGAAPDFLVSVDRAAAAYRSRHRMDPDSPLRVIAPVWLEEMLRADISMRMPGDGLEGNMSVADAVIDNFFTTRSINVTWSLDGEAGQIFGAQPAGALADFPLNVVWYLFAEGTFLFLDGGTLDLGLVRDSTLNGTNDYKMFIETFEGVAKVGIESLRITSRLAVTGEVAGTVATGTGLPA